MHFAQSNENFQAVILYYQCTVHAFKEFIHTYIKIDRWIVYCLDLSEDILKSNSWVDMALWLVSPCLPRTSSSGKMSMIISNVTALKNTYRDFFRLFLCLCVGVEALQSDRHARLDDTVSWLLTGFSRIWRFSVTLRVNRVFLLGLGFFTWRFCVWRCWHFLYSRQFFCWLEDLFSWLFRILLYFTYDI